MINQALKREFPLSQFITEYTERNRTNGYSPVAVGRYGIRTRESIYSKELATDYSKNKLIFKNTLTVGMGSKQIDIGILTEDEIYSVSPAYHTYKISGINSKYLDYCLQCRNQDMFTRYVKRGSRQGKSIDLKRWLNYEIPVYDETSQLEIVNILDKTSYLISMRDNQIVLLDELVKSQFIEMFGDITDRSHRFKTLKLGAVADVGSSHRVFTKEFVEMGIPFYRGTEIGELANNRQPTDLLYISAEKYNQLASDETKAVIGDLLMPSICNKGQIWMVNTNTPFYYKDGRVLHISPDRSIYNSRYLQYFMKVKTEFEYPFISSGSTFAEFKIFQLKNLDILTPPRELQDTFAAIIEQSDKSKFEIQKSKSALETLKKALMQKYFSPTKSAPD